MKVTKQKVSVQQYVEVTHFSVENMWGWGDMVIMLAEEFDDWEPRYPSEERERVVDGVVGYLHEQLMRDLDKQFFRGVARELENMNVKPKFVREFDTFGTLRASYYVELTEEQVAKLYKWRSEEAL